MTSTRGIETADIDTTALERASTSIAAIVQETASAALTRIGELVLEHVYDNDLALYASRAPRKDASLRQLARACAARGAPISAASLSNAVRIAVVARQLPAEAAFHTLPPSSRVALLGHGSPADIDSLAQELVAHGGATVQDVVGVVKARRELLQASTWAEADFEAELAAPFHVTARGGDAGNDDGDDDDDDDLEPDDQAELDALDDGILRPQPLDVLHALLCARTRLGLQTREMAFRTSDYIALGPGGRKNALLVVTHMQAGLSAIVDGIRSAETALPALSSSTVQSFEQSGVETASVP